MHKIAIRAETKPRTKLTLHWTLPVTLNRYVRGEPFEIFYEFRNDSDQPFPGGGCTLHITCQVMHLLEIELCTIPPLKPTETHKTESKTWGVLSEGHIGIICQDIKVKDGKQVELYRWDGRSASSNVFIHGFFAETWETLYQFWVVLISAISLLILAISLALGVYFTFLG